MSEIVTVRDLAMVTSDIQYAQRQGARQLASNLIEIGRLLVEAKTMVEPKNWDKYIWDNFGYSTSSADNWMKLYREYGDNQESLFDSFTNSQTFGKLSYTQLLALTALLQRNVRSSWKIMTLRTCPPGSCSRPFGSVMKPGRPQMQQKMNWPV